MLYFAYGANLHPLRLRIIAPSCEVVGAAMLADRALRFHKRGRDGSGKCDAFRYPGGQVHGVAYRVDVADEPALDRAEAGYDRVAVTAVLASGACAGFTYEAQPDRVDPRLRPWSWYRELVLLGARYQCLPAAYVTAIEEVPADDDSDVARLAEATALIARLRATVGSNSAPLGRVPPWPRPPSS